MRSSRPLIMQIAILHFGHFTALNEVTGLFSPQGHLSGRQVFGTFEDAPDVLTFSADLLAAIERCQLVVCRNTNLSERVSERNSQIVRSKSMEQMRDFYDLVLNHL